uniref:Fibronectin n=1 Tax=Eptatretus burgeri TaxID=7764 RepID=A0A8C4NB89_EPTBU
MLSPTLLTFHNDSACPGFIPHLHHMYYDQEKERKNLLKSVYFSFPATGDNTCLDNDTGRRYHAGDTWERHKHGSTWDCICLESGTGRVDCTTESTCCLLYCFISFHFILQICFFENYLFGSKLHLTLFIPYIGVEPSFQASYLSTDRCQVRGHSYKIGQRWQQQDSSGQHMLDCVCLGNGKGEWKCSGKGVPFENGRAAIFNVASMKCKGVKYMVGQSWLKKQGMKRLLCTCHKDGISCHSSDVLTFGGNAPGQSCTFPFTYMGIRYDTCTNEGRHDGKRWCSVTKKYDEDKRYTFCPAIVTKGGNSHGAICNFPFFYNGHKYTECTFAGRPDDMQWCSTTENYDIDHKFGFCPMELHEEVCVSHGVRYRVGDTWNKQHKQGYMMRCTCLGNGRGAWRCQAYSEILDQCIVEGNYYNVSGTFHKQHAKGYMMNCTCYGQSRGKWACDPIDQCEDLETNHFYQIGDEWNRVFKGQLFLCTCYGKGTGDICPLTGRNNPVDVSVVHTNRHHTSQPLEWTVHRPRTVRFYLLKWRPKDSRDKWREAQIPSRFTSYMITGLSPGVSYQGQLVTQSFSSNINNARSLTPFRSVEPDVGVLVTEIHSDSFTLSWPSSPMAISGYRVQYELTEGGQTPQILELDGSATSAVLHGLLPGHNYFVVVFEIYTNGREKLIIATSSNTGTSVLYRCYSPLDYSEFICENAPSRPSGYRVQYQPSAGGRNPLNLNLGPDVTTTILTDLLPGTSYNVSIFSVLDLTESAPLFLQFSTHGQPASGHFPSPQNVKFEHVTDTQAAFTWLPTSKRSNLIGYQVNYGKNGYAKVNGLPMTDFPYAEITGLHPGTTYDVEVTAIYENGHSRPLTLFSTSSQLEIDGPRHVQALKVSETEVTLGWQPPLAPITGYIIRCERTDGNHQREEVVESTDTDLYSLHEHYGMLTISNLLFIHVPILIITLNCLFLWAEMTRASKFLIESSESSIIVSWNSLPQQMVRPYLGGEDSREFTSDTGSLVVTELRPGTEYFVNITAFISGRQQGPPIERIVFTGTYLHSVPIENPGELRVSWKTTKLQGVTSYRITCTPTDVHDDPAETLQEFVAPTQNHTEFHKLVPGKEYNISAYTVADALQSPPTSMIIIPGKLTCISSTIAVLLSWSLPPIDDHAGFWLEVFPAGSEPIISMLLDPNDRQYKISGLEPGVEYKINLSTLTTEGQILQSPTDITFSDVTPTSFSVSWEPPRGQITGYRVTYEGGEQGEREVPHAPGPDNTNVRIEGLMPGVDYIIRIYTLNERWESPPLVSSHSTVSGITFEEVGPDFIVISWQKPRNQITGYRVTYEAGEQGEREVPHAPGPDDTRVRIEGLIPGVDYILRIYTLYGRWESPPLILRHSTGQLNIYIKSLSLIELITGYRVTYEGGEQGEREVPHAPGPDNTNVRIEGLVPGVDYIIRIYTLNGRWESPPLVSISETTVDEVGPDFIVVSWQKPRDQITGYRVTYEAGEQGEREVPRAPGPEDTSIRIEGLRPSVDYIIRIYTIYRHWESPPLVLRHSTGQLSIFKTCCHLTEHAHNERKKMTTIFVMGVCLSVSLSVLFQNFQTTQSYQVLCLHCFSAPAASIQVSEATVNEVGPDFIVVSWQKPHGQISGYRVTYEGAERREKDVLRVFGPDDTNIRIEGLIPGVKYIIRIYTLYRHQESRPFIVRHSTTGLYVSLKVTNADHCVQCVRQSGNLMSNQVSPYPDTQRCLLCSPCLTLSLLFGRVIGIPFGSVTFADGKAILPSRGVVPYTSSQTVKVISWNPRYRVSQYLITCSWVAYHDSITLPQARLPGSITSARLVGLRPGVQYRVLVEGLRGRQRFKIMEEIISLLETGALQCYDRDTGRHYNADDEWEKDSGSGLKLLCRCLEQGGRNHIRCDSSRWCLDRGKSYSIGESWSKTTAQGRRMKCTCLGNNMGQFKCEPDETRCFHQGKEYSVGQQWTQRDKGMDCKCTCIGGRKVSLHMHIATTSKEVQCQPERLHNPFPRSDEIVFV